MGVITKDQGDGGPLPPTAGLLSTACCPAAIISPPASLTTLTDAPSLIRGADLPQPYCIHQRVWDLLLVHCATSSQCHLIVVSWYGENKTAVLSLHECMILKYNMLNYLCAFYSLQMAIICMHVHHCICTRSLDNVFIQYTC